MRAQSLSRGWRYVGLGIAVLVVYVVIGRCIEINRGIRLLGTLLIYGVLFGLYGRKGSGQQRLVYLSAAAVFCIMGLLFYFMGKRTGAW